MQEQFDDIRQIDPKMARINPLNSVKKPETVDNIPFIAMMELQSLLGKDNSDTGIGELMTLVIAIVCFNSNFDKDFDIDSVDFIKFKEKILDENLLDMFGLYNWIDESIKQTETNWQKLFFEVEVADKDYDSAGGERMGNFNVINTIKSICIDFNLPYSKALQMDYGITQTNSLSKATQSHIQKLMTDIAQARMKQQSKQ